MPIIGSERESIEMARVFFQKRAGNLSCYTERIVLDTSAHLLKHTHTSNFLWEPSLPFFDDLHACVCVFVCQGWRIPTLPPLCLYHLPNLEIVMIIEDLYGPSSQTCTSHLTQISWASYCWQMGKVESGEKSRYIRYEGLRGFIRNRSEPDF